MASEIQNEITIKIPEVYSNKFSTFFGEFDANLAQLKIRNYGISISSLEEVFMKIGNLDDLSNFGTQNAPLKDNFDPTIQD